MGRRNEAGREYTSLSLGADTSGTYQRGPSSGGAWKVVSIEVQNDTMEAYPVVAPDGFWFIETPKEVASMPESVEDALISAIHLELTQLVDDPQALKTALQALEDIRKHKEVRDEELNWWTKAAGSSMVALWDNDEDAVYNDL